MAIAQSRVIALITAGMDYKFALEKLIQHIHTHSLYIKDGNMPPIDAMNYIISIASPDFLLNSIQSSAVLATEHRHFYRNSRRNERRAQIAALKRRAEGKTTRNTYQPDMPIPISTSLPTLPQPPDSSPLTPAQQMEIIQEAVKYERLEDRDREEDASLSSGDFIKKLIKDNQ